MFFVNISKLLRIGKNKTKNEECFVGLLATIVMIELNFN